MSFYMDKEFPIWLRDQRIDRGWSQSDLARTANINRQVISDYEGFKRKNYDETILRKIARALKLPPEQVFRAAGLLPPKPEEDPWVEEMSHKINLVPASSRGIVGRFLDSVIEDEDEERKNKKTSTKRVKQQS